MSPTHEPAGFTTGAMQNAGERAYKRAVQAVAMLAVLGRGDLLTMLSEEITKREKEMG